MAIVHGKSGQFAKDQAARLFFWLFAGTAVLCAICGVGAGLLLAWRSYWLGAAAGIAALASVWVGERLLRKPMDKLARRRIWILRGAQVEALVAWLLQDLDDSWHIFNGIKLEEAADIDHIVVGPGGVYCISTKSQRGLFSLAPAPDGRVFYNNQPTRLIGDTLGQTMRLCDRLKALLGADVPFITAVLAVPLAYVEFAGPKNSVWVLHQENLLGTLENAPKRLDKQQIARCAKALEMLDGAAADVYRRERELHMVGTR